MPCDSARLTEARWAAMSGNEKGKRRQYVGQRRPATAHLGESAPPPTAGDDDDKHLPGH